MVAIAAICLNPYVKMKHHALLQMFVQKEKRGKGVGSYLLQKMEGIARDEHKLKWIDIEIYDSPYRKWFEKRGFYLCVEQKKFLKSSGKYKARQILRKDL